VHNPFGKALGKASDPYINSFTLVRLSHSKDQNVRAAVAENLAARLSRGSLTFFERKNFPRFDRMVVVQSLLNPESRDPSGKAMDLISEFIKNASGKEAEVLINSTSSFVRSCTAQNPRTKAEDIVWFMLDANPSQSKIIFERHDRVKREKILTALDQSGHMELYQALTGRKSPQLQLYQDLMQFRASGIILATNQISRKQPDNN